VRTWSIDVLIIRLYERLGDDFVAHLRGDWWLALWDGRRRRLLLARDATSQTPLYHASHGGAFVLAPSPAELLAVPGFPARPCEERLVALLTGSLHQDYWQTELEGVFQVLPGRLLVIDEQGVDERRYWFPESLPLLQMKHDDDYVERFLELYRDAVACRVVSVDKVGSMLSGGLDSGSVSVLAAECLAVSGRRLPAFTHVPLAEVREQRLPSRIIDEWPLAHATAALSGHIDHHVVDSAGISPLLASTALTRATGLISFSPNGPWLHVMHQMARDQSLGLLLNGQAGNFFASWGGGMPAVSTLIRDGRWRAACSRLTAGRAVTPGLLMHLVTSRLQQKLKPKLESTSAKLWHEHLALNPTLAAHWHPIMSARGPAEAPRTPRQQRDSMADMFLAATTVNSLNAAAYGLAASDPTADQRLIEFCLAIPDAQYACATQDRLLMRRAMRDLLPHNVCEGRARGFQPADHVWRLLAARDEIEALLDAMQHSALTRHFLDVQVLRKGWAGLRPELMMSPGTANFSRGLGIGLFLIQLDGVMPSGLQGDL
jgi:asparagine synthase (glutamine-hydrolysing)